MKLDAHTPDGSNLRNYAIMLVVAVSFLIWFANTKHVAARELLKQRECWELVTLDEDKHHHAIFSDRYVLAGV